MASEYDHVLTVRDLVRRLRHAPINVSTVETAKLLAYIERSITKQEGWETGCEYSDRHWQIAADFLREWSSHNFETVEREGVKALVRFERDVQAQTIQAVRNE